MKLLLVSSKVLKANIQLVIYIFIYIIIISFPNLMEPATSHKYKIFSEVSI